MHLHAVSLMCEWKVAVFCIWELHSM